MKKKLFTLLVLAMFLTKMWGQDAFVGEIRMFAGNYAPLNWMLCQGQVLNIGPNQALFSILGTTYGGDGINTFALPNLCGRVPIGQGQGAGLTPKVIGVTGGVENVSLNTSQLPAHTHALMATTATATTSTPSSTVVPATAQLPASGASGAKNVNVYAPSSGNPTVTTYTSTSGGNQSFSIMQPYLVINYIICINGIYPARN